jgi:hypothetical protein
MEEAGRGDLCDEALKGPSEGKSHFWRGRFIPAGAKFAQLLKVPKPAGWPSAVIEDHRQKIWRLRPALGWHVSRTRSESGRYNCLDPARLVGHAADEVKKETQP